MRVAYDLDGVLRLAPPPNKKKWGLMKGPERQARLEQLRLHYKTAPRLLNPHERFYVISACKENTREINEAWLWHYYGERVRGLYLLNTSRSLRAVVEFKARTLEELRIARFTEDNLSVLKGVQELYPACQYYYYDGKADPCELNSYLNSL